MERLGDLSQEKKMQIWGLSRNLGRVGPMGVTLRATQSQSAGTQRRSDPCSPGCPRPHPSLLPHSWPAVTRLGSSLAPGGLCMWKGFLFREIHRRRVQVAVNQGEPSAKENTRFAVTPRASLPASQPGPGTEFSLPPLIFPKNCIPLYADSHLPAHAHRAPRNGPGPSKK